MPKPHERLSSEQRTFRKYSVATTISAFVNRYSVLTNSKKNVLEVNGLVKAFLSPPQLPVSFPLPFRRAATIFPGEPFSCFLLRDNLTVFSTGL